LRLITLRPIPTITHLILDAIFYFYFVKLSIFFTAWQGHTKLRKEQHYVLGPCCATTRASAWYLKLHKKITGWKVEQLYIHKFIYLYIYHIWRKSFSSKTCYICHGHESQYLFEWVILNGHLQSTVIPGEQAARSYIFRDVRSQFSLIEVLCSPSPHMGQFKLDFK